MENIKAQIAFDLVPVIRHLYEGGITAVNGSAGTIHMTEDLFHEVFPNITEPKNRDSREYPYEWETTVEGVKFFALSKEVRNDGED